MSGGIDRLTDVRVRAFLQLARAGTATAKKLSDGQGLYLTLTRAGTAVWRVKYRHSGKEKVYAIGVYPEISLLAARAERDSVRAHLRTGSDPVRARLLSRAENAVASDDSFAAATAAWLARRKREWSAVHYLKSSQALERDALPFLGRLPVAGITSAMVARVIERVVARGANETATKILWNVRGVFELAQTRPGSRMRENPAIAARAVLTQSKPHVPRAALLTFDGLGDLLRRTEAAAISPAVRMAHRLVAFTAARIGNAVEAQWKEFDLDSDTPSWIVPRTQMKMRHDRQHDHRTLLGPSITHELRTWRAVTGGRGYVFPSPHGKVEHITREALEKSYRVTLGMEGKHSVHGWRASFSTLARDAGFSRDVVELSLDHVHDNAVARAYDRGQRLTERIRLMRWWGLQLAAAQAGMAVLPQREDGVA